MAIRAVMMSTESTRYMGRAAMSTAPRGGAAMEAMPLTDSLRPLTRARWAWGTISEVEACMAGQWKPESMERSSSTAIMWTTSTVPRANIIISPRVRRAVRPSATIITRRRFQRSTSAPAKGVRNTWGSMPITDAKVNIVAEPVSTVSHQIRANCTSWLPNSEKAWPVQTVKNRLAHMSFSTILPLCSHYPVARTSKGFVVSADDHAMSRRVTIPRPCRRIPNRTAPRAGSGPRTEGISAFPWGRRSCCRTYPVRRACRTWGRWPGAGRSRR